MHVCAQWSVATSDLVPRGIGTGVSVIPIGYWSPASLASAAATVGELTNGKFVLGIGAGALADRAFRRSLGLDPRLRPIATMREWLVTLHALLAGQTVDHEGAAITLHGVSLGSAPPRVPVALGALGPNMLTLAGEASDAAALNWCTPEQVAASRETVAAGARGARRDPSEIAMVEYIRICVDDDVEAARRGYVKALMGYALGRPGSNKEFGCRDHHALALQTDPPTLTEVAERLVHRLPRRPDQLRQLLLRQIVFHPEGAVLLHPVPLRQPQQLLGQPAGHVGEDEVREQVVGPAQSPGEYPQQSFGDLGTLGDPGAQRRAVHGCHAYVVDGGRGRRTGARVEYGQLAEGFGRAPHGEERVVTPVG
jgi:alkanesulfonate monooxygenase SsuD/methylene tetrahydromethanopterin reductase-like flavin-dependent oxidoreductase (luciferase family)